MPFRPSGWPYFFGRGNFTDENSAGFIDGFGRAYHVTNLFWLLSI
jgi:hypothetical protein